MKNALCAVAAAVLLPAVAAGQGVRPAAFAGQFYPSDPARLAAQIDGWLAAAAPPAPHPGRVLALVAPHAGYDYSGPTAAAAYAAVRGRAYDAVVIVGPSHRLAFEGVSVWPDGGFETPLGTAPVDAGLARDLARAARSRFLPEAFAQEHSVEVQVPFVQRALPGAAIVPVVMGRQTGPTIRAFAAALAKACRGRRVLVVASTDLSHFLPEGRAKATDADTTALIAAMKTETVIRRVEAGDNIMCGGGPVAAALIYAAKSGRARVEILGRTDSAAFGGPVVGYLAAAVLADAEAEPGGFELGAAERAELLGLARAAVAAAAAGRAPDRPAAGRAWLDEPRGVFVTLRKKGGLRGCIGYAEPAEALRLAVVQAAAYAATADPRFPPVRPGELADIVVEISVLTPLREIADARLVEVGRHGLVLSRGERRGLLLPQVPVENGWGRETFLEQACLKAGLPADDWRRGARIQVFEAVVFHE